MSEVVLQERVTLDEALLAGTRTYRNGCNFRLLRRADGSYWLQYGCYPLPALETGHGALLVRWLGSEVKRQLTGNIHPRTIYELLKRQPCDRCHGVRFELKAAPAEAKPREGENTPSE